MGTYLNPGNKKFQEKLNSKKTYVDKTDLIRYTNEAMDADRKYICVSHPRRFGKSFAANMLVAYYGRGCGSREQFKGQKIASDPSFEKHLNKYDVIHLDIAGILYSTEPRYSIDAVIADIEDTVTRELRHAYPLLFLGGKNLVKCLDKVYRRKKTPFVFVIDEWDAPIREKDIGDKDKKIYLEFLLGLLKEKAYVGLAYMTGILPIKIEDNDSSLNMFDEYTMTNSGPLGEFFGFTEDEVREVCKGYGVPFENLKEWYDGYDVGGVPMYNPNSVTKALMHNELDSYWANTGPFESLRRYITMNLFGLKAKILILLSGDEVPVDTGTFKRDLGRLDSADEVLTALIHLGYLTYSRERGTARIPNHEIRLEFENAMKDTDEWQDVIAAIMASDELMKSLLRGEAAAVAEGMYEAHESSASVIEYNDENSLACTIRIALYAAMKDYVFIRELPAGKGFADVVLVPKEWKAVPPVIVELKYGDSAEGAIAQIKERRYADRFIGLKRDIYLVGINYDEKSKVHECAIEKYRNA